MVRGRRDISELYNSDFQQGINYLSPSSFLANHRLLILKLGSLLAGNKSERQKVYLS